GSERRGPRTFQPLNEDKATRYHRLKRQASVVSLVWTGLLLAGLLVTGLTGALRDAAARLLPPAPVIGERFLLTVPTQIGALAMAFYNGYVLERRYDLSNERLGAWLRDQLKSFAIAVILGGGAASVVYFLMRMSPERWWLTSGLVFAVLIVGMTNLAPIVL